MNYCLKKIWHIPFIIMAILFFYTDAMALHTCQEWKKIIQNSKKLKFPMFYNSDDVAFLFKAEYRNYYLAIAEDSCQVELNNDLSEIKIKWINEYLKQILSPQIKFLSESLKTETDEKNKKVLVEGLLKWKRQFQILTNNKPNQESLDENEKSLLSIVGSEKKIKMNLKIPDTILTILSDKKLDLGFFTPKNSKNMGIKNPSCPTIEVSNEGLNRENVTDQQNLGNCYAHVTAGLLSYHYNQQISPLSLTGGNFNEITNKDTLGGEARNLTDNFFSYLDKYNGLCLEKNLKSADYGFITGPHLLNVFVRLRSYLNGNGGDCYPCLMKDLFHAFPRLDWAQEFAGLNSIPRKSINILSDIINAHCKPDNMIAYGKKNELKNLFWTYHSLPKSELLKKVKEQLAKSKPVALTIDAKKIMSEDGWHGIMVVGQKFNAIQNRCEYLVRNSQGKTCLNQFYRDEEQRCDISNSHHYTGHMWVSESRLESMIAEVTVIKDKEGK